MESKDPLQEHSDVSWEGTFLWENACTDMSYFVDAIFCRLRRWVWKLKLSAPAAIESCTEHYFPEPELRYRRRHGLFIDDHGGQLRVLVKRYLERQSGSDNLFHKQSIASANHRSGYR
ncbi:MAG: hypothetical protein WCB11_25115 [Terriglobales bacterium]